jgi:hypothetical protein
MTHFPDTLLSRSIAPAFSSTEGGTSLQSQVDGLVGDFIQQATDWRSLTSMIAGGMAYRLGRIGTMTVGVQNFEPLRRIASVGIGLGAEVTAFEMTNRALTIVGANGYSPLPPNLWRWEGQGGIRQGFLSSLVTFGSLKGAGRLAQGENVVVQHLLQDTGMVLGHQVSGVFGITQRPTGSLAEQFLHAEVTNLQLSAGMALAHSVAPGAQGLERGLDLSLRTTERGAVPLQIGPRPALATAGGPETFTTRDLKSPPIFHMSSQGEGGAADLSRFGNRQLIREARSGRFDAAHELWERAVKWPFLFFQKSEIHRILEVISESQDPTIQRMLTGTLMAVLRNGWSRFDKGHVEKIVALQERGIMINPVLDLLGMIRPDLMSKVLSPPFSDPVTRNRDYLVERSKELFSVRLEHVRITAESCEVSGVFNPGGEAESEMTESNNVVRLPLKTPDDPFDPIFRERTWVRFTNQYWTDRIEKALGKVRSGKRGAQERLQEVIQEYLDEPAIGFSALQDSKYTRASGLCFSNDPEIHEALLLVNFTWLSLLAEKEYLPYDLLGRLASFGHKLSLIALMDLSNRGFEQAHLTLEELERELLVHTAIHGKDVTAVEDLVRFFPVEMEKTMGLLKILEGSLKIDSFSVAEVAAAELVKMGEGDQKQRPLERLSEYRGEFFEPLKKLVSERRLSPVFLDFLRQAALLTSYEAVDVLTEAAVGDLKAQAILSQLLQKIPFQRMPPVVELEGNVSLDEAHQIYVRMRRQEVRRRVGEALRRLTKGS